MNGFGIVDAHQHCWQLDRAECVWPSPALSAIYRDFGPDDFWREASPCGVSSSVLIQSQADEADTDYLLSLAEQWPAMAGVVGWTDLSAPDAASRVRALARLPRLCGLRPMLETLTEDDWILQRAQPTALAAMAEQGLVFDALVHSRHLPVLMRLVEDHPGLTVVLDHAAKPNVAEGEFECWRHGLLRLARYPSVHCKLSGLLTELAPCQPWEHLTPYVETIVEAFGPERLLWGSDWPVLKQAGDYARWLALAWQQVQRLLPGQESKVFRDNARRLYCLTGP